VDELIEAGTEDSELVEVTDAGSGSDQMDDNVDGCGQLAVHSVAGESSCYAQRLDPGRQVGR